MSDVSAVLAERYGLAGSRCVADISERVVRVATQAGDVAVKSFSSTELDRAEREARIILHLSSPSSRYRVQTLVCTTGGEPFAPANGEGAVVVTRWEAGEKKAYTDISAHEWRMLGTELAALHERLDHLPLALPRLSSECDVAEERAAIESLRTRVAGHAEVRRLRRPTPRRGIETEIDRYLDARLALLAEVAGAAAHTPRGPEGPIHNDYNQHNYLFCGASPAVITDWERAISAPREYEVVRCMNHLPIVAPANAAAFLDGYREARPLDLGRLGWAVDRSLLDHARKNWPLERWLAGAGDAERLLRGSIEVLQVLRRGRAQLASFFAGERR